MEDAVECCDIEEEVANEMELQQLSQELKVGDELNLKIFIFNFSGNTESIVNGPYLNIMVGEK